MAEKIKPEQNIEKLPMGDILKSSLMLIKLIFLNFGGLRFVSSIGIKAIEKSKEINKQADLLNSRFNGKLENWAKTRRNGGNSPSGMKSRLDIIEELCLN